MSDTFGGYVPPVGFYYAVYILGKNNRPFPEAEASFQEVSGITAKLETEEIKEGGQNRFTHHVPGRAKYDNLVLRRGLMVRSSALGEWCLSIFKQNLNKQIEPKTIRVALLDANTDGDGAIMSWVFTNAYPIKWEVSSLDAQKSEIVVES
ncbi:MAG: phage tail protein, partial [Bacteroidota bacterium]